MNGHRIARLGRFAALLVVAGAFACGDPPTPPDPNRAPIALGLIPPLSMVVGQSETLDASQFFSDPDGDQLTYSASSSQSSVVGVSVSGSNVTATAVAAGQATVTVTATDPDGLSASHTADVTVEAANESPVATDTIPPQTITAGDTVTIDASAHFSDPDGDALTFTASSSDTDAATVSVDGSTVAIVGVAEGSATVTVTATDPEGASAMQEVAVTVKAPNRAPVAVGEIPEVPMTVGQVFSVPIDQFFMDPDGDTLTYEATSSDTTVVTASMAANVITVAAVGVGEATITITASDPEGLSATQTTTATVTALNQAPELTDSIPDQEMTEGDTVALDVSNNFSDPDGDSLAFSAETDDDAVATVSVDGSTVTIVGVGVGTATVTVTATDPEGLSATQIFGVAVASANRAPQAVGEIPEVPMTVGDVFTVPVDAFFMDPDGDTLAYSAMSSDTTVVTASMAANLITVVAVGVGTATITITATDPDGLSATQSTTATVSALNQAPELTDSIPNQEMAPGDTVTLDLSDNFSDPDGDSLAFSAETDDTAVATVSVDGSTMTIVAVGEGTATVTVTAADPEGLSAEQFFGVAVASGNRAPKAVGEIPAQNLKAGRSATVDVAGNFSDPDGDELSYAAASSDDAVASVSISGTEVTITGVAAGTATLTVTATDPDGLSAVQEAEVAVVANQAPQISDTVPIHDLLVVLDSTDMTVVDTLNWVVLDMSDYFSDPDDAELTYTASVADDGIATVESVEGSVVTTLAVSSDTSFAHDTTMLTVTATDPNGESVTQEAMVLVANSDYEVWDVIEITEDGTIAVASLGITLGSCFGVPGLNLGGTWYRVDWTAWQVRSGTGWVMIPGTYAEVQVCPYLDLPDAPAGTYRLVGEVFIGDPAGDTVLARRKSGNDITIEESSPPPPSVGAAPDAPGPSPAQPLPPSRSSLAAVRRIVPPSRPVRRGRGALPQPSPSRRRLRPRRR